MLMELSVTRTPGVSVSKPTACTQPPTTTLAPPIKLVIVLFRITRPEFTVLPFRDDAGHIVGIAAILRDVTKRFEEMKALRQQLAERGTR